MASGAPKKNRPSADAPSRPEHLCEIKKLCDGGGERYGGACAANIRKPGKGVATRYFTQGEQWGWGALPATASHERRVAGLRRGKGCKSARRGRSGVAGCGRVKRSRKRPPRPAWPSPMSRLAIQRGAEAAGLCCRAVCGSWRVRVTEEKPGVAAGVAPGGVPQTDGIRGATATPAASAAPKKRRRRKDGCCRGGALERAIRSGSGPTTLHPTTSIGLDRRSALQSSVVTKFGPGTTATERDMAFPRSD